MIRADRISVRFGSWAALRDVSLDLAPGQRLGIVGESGSGKSMLGLTLMGMLPDSADLDGALSIDGQPMAQASDRRWRALRARRIAMIFQEPRPWRSTRCGVWARR